MTEFRDLFAALAEPFGRTEVRIRKGTGKDFSYVTARTVMNRLDNVLGPENWWDDYTPGEHSVLCRLTIRLPNGITLTKSDAGGYAGMSDEGDDEKSGYSDAFKRASVKFGVGRELYGDGVANLSGAINTKTNTPLVERNADKAIQRATQPPQADPWLWKIPAPGKPVYAWAKGLEGYFGVSIIPAMRERGKSLGSGTNFLDWPEETVHTIAHEVISHIKTLEKYQGQFDQIEAPGVKTDDGVLPKDWPALKVCKRQIIDAAKKVVKFSEGREGTDAEVKDAILAFSEASANRDGKTDQALGSLSECGDLVWLENTLSTALRHLKMIAADAAAVTNGNGSSDMI